MELSDLIQIGIGTAAVGASIVALVVSSKDRKHAARIASLDRQSSARRELLALKLDVAIRLAENLARGGSTDKDESARLGAEALALITVLGEEYVPTQWQKRVGDVKNLEEKMDDSSTEAWVKNKIEAGLAVQALTRELRMPRDRNLEVS